MQRCLNCESRFAASGWRCPHCGWAPPMDAGMPVFAPQLALEVAGYESALFEAHGGALADGSFWTSARSALIAWALRTYVPNAQRFLEVGCGTGSVLAHLEQACPELTLTGAEALLPGLHAAQRRLRRTQLMQFDATRIPFDAEFDAVGAFDVIEHIEDDDAVMAAMADALRPGGVLLITVPQHPFLFGPADVSARHQRRYTRRGLVSQAARLGLTVDGVTSFVSLLFPAMAAARLMSKWRGGPYDSAEEFTSGPLNDVFGKVMDLERWTIRHGARWPFGGSLLLVARKAAA